MNFRGEQGSTCICTLLTGLDTKSCGLSWNIWSGNRKWSGQTKKHAIFSPATSYTVLPQWNMWNCESTNREDLVMPQEDHMTEFPLKKTRRTAMIKSVTNVRIYLSVECRNFQGPQWSSALVARHGTMLTMCLHLSKHFRARLNGFVTRVVGSSLFCTNSYLLVNPLHTQKHVLLDVGLQWQNSRHAMYIYSYSMHCCQMRS